MKRIGVRELNQQTSHVIERVKQGEVIEVTDRGRPVARLVPAIHLATALQMGAQLEAFVTYDRRLETSARDAGLPVAAP